MRSPWTTRHLNFGITVYVKCQQRQNETIGIEILIKARKSRICEKRDSEKALPQNQ